MKVKLIYFKSTGKYYSEGEYISSHLFPWDVINEVRKMVREGKLPGLVRNSTEWYILVETDYELDVPRLITDGIKQ